MREVYPRSVYRAMVRIAGILRKIRENDLLELVREYRSDSNADEQSDGRSRFADSQG